MKCIPSQDRKTLKLAVEDSYETGGQNWIDGFADEFKQNMDIVWFLIFLYLMEML